jgi:hypothetical protein
MELKESKEQKSKEFSEFLLAKNKNVLHTQVQKKECVWREKNILTDSNSQNLENLKNLEDKTEEIEKVEIIEKEDINPTILPSIPEQPEESEESKIMKDYLENGWKKPVCPEEVELSRLKDQNGFKPTSLDKKGLVYSASQNYKITNFKPEIDPTWTTEQPHPFADYLPPSLHHLFHSSPPPSSLPVIKKKPRVILGFEKNLREQQIGPAVNLYKREIVLGDD